MSVCSGVWGLSPVVWSLVLHWESDLEYKTSGSHRKILSQTHECTVLSWMDMPATFDEDWLSHSSAPKKQNCDALLLPQFSLHTCLDNRNGKEMEE